MATIGNSTTTTLDAAVTPSQTSPQLHTQDQEQVTTLKDSATSLLWIVSGYEVTVDKTGKLTSLPYLSCKTVHGDHGADCSKAAPLNVDGRNARHPSVETDTSSLSWPDFSGSPEDRQISIAGPLQKHVERTLRHCDEYHKHDGEIPTHLHIEDREGMLETFGDLESTGLKNPPVDSRATALEKLKSRSFDFRVYPTYEALTGLDKDHKGWLLSVTFGPSTTIGGPFVSPIRAKIDQAMKDCNYPLHPNWDGLSTACPEIPYHIKVTQGRPILDTDYTPANKIHGREILAALRFPSASQA